MRVSVLGCQNHPHEPFEHEPIGARRRITSVSRGIGHFCQCSTTSRTTFSPINLLCKPNTPRHGETVPTGRKGGIGPPHGSPTIKAIFLESLSGDSYRSSDLQNTKEARPDRAHGRMGVELSEFGICYQLRGSVKGQHLAYFAAELPLTREKEWSLYVDGTSGRAASEADIVLEGPNGFLLEHSLVFNFKMSNNQAEFEALIAGLELAKDTGARKLVCRTNSQLVVGKMNGEFQVKEDNLLQYYHKASALAQEFEQVKIQHIPRQQNARADMLSKLCVGKEKGQLTTIIRQVLLQPSIECHAITNEEADDWRKEIKELMKK